MDNLELVSSIMHDTESKLNELIGYRVKIKLSNEFDKQGVPNYIIIDAFVKAAAHSEDVSIEDLQSSKRLKTEICDLRHILWLILNTEAYISLVEIAAYFERHHTTIISGIRYIGNIIDTEENARLKYQRLSTIGQQIFQIKKYFK